MRGQYNQIKIGCWICLLKLLATQNLCRERVNPTSNNEISSKAVQIHTDRCRDVMCIYCHNWLKGVLWLGKYPHINWVHFYFKQSTIIWYVIPHDEFWT